MEEIAGGSAVSAVEVAVEEKRFNPHRWQALLQALSSLSHAHFRHAEKLFHFFLKCDFREAKLEL